jgi:hypothetical protein
MIILSDIDGVLCDPRAYVKMFLLQGRKDWDRYFQNTLSFPAIPKMCEMIGKLGIVSQVFYGTSRPESNRQLTTEWLSHTMLEGVQPYQLCMRKDGDRRPSALIKVEIANTVHPDITFEDEPESVIALRAEGYFVMQIYGYRLPNETPADLIPS